MYIHELTDWPRFGWKRGQLTDVLAATRHQQGKLIGTMEALGFPLRQEAVLETLSADVVKTSEIEGEKLDIGQVRSSVARRLGIDIGALKPADRNVEGVVEMTLDATENYLEPLTAERIFGWHAALFPGGRSGLLRIRVGAWRDDRTGPMQVVSGAEGHERVHFEAPAAARLDRETSLFLEWFNGGGEGMDPVLKAALAHLWFVTIHPLDDGNGRIARAIADMALARSEESPRRFYSMSAQIRKERNAYYGMLGRIQSGMAGMSPAMDITPWMRWFLGCLGRAIEGAHTTLRGVLARARFWEAMQGIPLNARQTLLLNRLLEGFEGKLTTIKWAKLAQCSHDTALRDIKELTSRGILLRGSEGGRSTRYELAQV
jgi:Fic family protein